MRTYLDCIPCFFKQALEASRISGASRITQKKVLDELAKILPKFSLNTPPPLMGRVIYKLVSKLTKNLDPYREIKIKSNELALNIYPKLKRKVALSKDRLKKAIELAIAANSIDYGVRNSLNIEEELKRILREEEKTIKVENKRFFEYEEFKKALNKAKTILYLGDNAGEVVFDRVLIEEIKKIDKNKKIIYAVKSKPIINDALVEDALQAGIHKVAEIILSGVDAPGTVLSLCSKEFLKVYKNADLIISKGQGNFEALSDKKRPIFYLFMAKCKTVANHLGCKLRDIILFHNLNNKVLK